MEEQRTNGNSCKNKWVLAITAIIILAGSNIYFFTKYNEQSKLIENQVHYINELNANITKSSTDDDTNAHFDKLFNLTWNTFKNKFHLESQNFDIISIDIEGMDYDVLSQMNLTELDCKVLCVEFNGKDMQKYIDYAQLHGMILQHQNPENLIFLK